MNGRGSSAGPAGGETVTMCHLLDRRAAEQSDRVGYVYLADGVSDERTLTYGELRDRARAVARQLRDRVSAGDRALLLYPAGLDFICAFFGCLYAGVVAVPVSSPGPQVDRTVDSLIAVAADCGPAALLTTGDIASLASSPGVDAGPLLDLAVLPTDGPAGHDEPEPFAPIDPASLAFLQYTSGSTSMPRGVMISHANLMANMRAAREAVGQGSETVCVTWLPHFHDMGLGGLLSSLYAGNACVFMSPMAFLERPLRWLRAITKYGGTWSGGPNFALDLCVRRAGPEDLAALDLTSLATLSIGSEPVRAESLERFARAFSPVGFRSEAFMPCYGLAESVVFVAGQAERCAPLVVWFDADRLGRNEVAETTAGPSGGRALVGCGRPSAGHEVAIVDVATGGPVEPGRIGEVWVRGASVAGGYWNRPKDTRAAFDNHLAGGGPFLRTGDLGFVWDGELFIAGRLKDVIIVGGANHHPQDIERTVERSHPALRPGCSAAFSVDVGGERVVVVAEVRNGSAPAEGVIRAIRSAVAHAHSLTVDGVGLMPARSTPKTSSGKVRRQACRAGWLSGQLDLVARWESAELRLAEFVPGDTKEAALPGEAAGDGDAGKTSPAFDRLGSLESAIRERVIAMLGDGDTPIDLGEPLINVGLGSIEMAELKAVLEADLELTVPLNALLQGWSIRDIATSVLDDGSARSATRAPGAGDGAGRYEELVNPDLGRLLRRLRMDKRFVRGEGCWLFDHEGNRYLDAIAGFGSVPFGHNPPEIWEALMSLREAGEPAFVQPSSLEAASELAEGLIRLAPPGMRFAAFCNSGAEAAEAAIKLVRAATGRPGILSTVNGFHGKTLGALSATGRRAYQEPFGAPVEGFEFVPFGEIAAIERALSERPGYFAGFIVEPIQGEGGIVEPPRGYLSAARGACHAHGVRFILDEVQTGLGRTGRLFACEEEGVTPDVLMVAKALGGGLLPVGAVLYGDGAYSQSFALRHTSTFAGNAPAARVGLAVLDLLTRDGGALLGHVRAVGSRLRDGLEGVRARHPSIVRSVRGRGLMLGLELTTEREAFGRESLLGLLAEQEQLGALLSSYLLNAEAVRVAPTVLSSTVVRIEPPLNFTEEMCDRVVGAVERAVQHLDRRDTAATVGHLLARPRTPPAADLEPSRPPRRRPVAPEADAPRWAFVAHPLDAADYRHFDRSLQALSRAEIEDISDRVGGLVDPFVIGGTRVASEAGATSYGEFIVVPRTAEELRSMDHGSAMSLVTEAVALARDRGAQVVGLGGHISVVSGAGLDLGDPGVPITSGNSFTAVTALQTARVAFNRLQLPASEASVAVIGASGSVGGGLTLLLAREVGRLILLGNPAHADLSVRLLGLLAEQVVASLLTPDPTHPDDGSPGGPLRVRVNELAAGAGSRDVRAVARQLLEEGLVVVGADGDSLLPRADVVFTATSSIREIVEPRHLRPGAVACDLSRPFNVAPSVRIDRPTALVIDGGITALPGRVDLGWDFGLPPGTAFACMCEPMIFALERAYDQAVVGLSARMALMANLARWAARHGFQPELRTFGRPVTDEDWDRAREARQARPATPRAAAVRTAAPGGG